MSKNNTATSEKSGIFSIPNPEKTTGNEVPDVTKLIPQHPGFQPPQLKAAPNPKPTFESLGVFFYHRFSIENEVATYDLSHTIQANLAPWQKVILEGLQFPVRILNLAANFIEFGPNQIAFHETFATGSVCSIQAIISPQMPGILAISISRSSLSKSKNELIEAWIQFEKSKPSSFKLEIDRAA